MNYLSTGAGFQPSRNPSFFFPAGPGISDVGRLSWQVPVGAYLPPTQRGKVMFVLNTWGIRLAHKYIHIYMYIYSVYMYMYICMYHHVPTIYLFVHILYFLVLSCTVGAHFFQKRWPQRPTDQFPASRLPSSIKCVVEVKRRVARSLLSSVERERLRHRNVETFRGFLEPFSLKAFNFFGTFFKQRVYTWCLF